MLYKGIFAVGDSFTRGDELADCPEQQVSPYQNSFSQSTWPALVAKSLNVDYNAEAIGGKGNQWISFTTNGNIKQDNIFIINWTWFERFDYVGTETDIWETTHPRHENKLDHYFYKNIDNDIWNLFRNLQQMHSTIQLLKQHNIKFIMTCLDPEYTTKVLDIHPYPYPRPPGLEAWDPAVDRLHDQVVPHILDFEGQTFLEWSHSNNFKCGPNGHPLEDAHAAAADYIIKNKLHF